MYMGGESSMAAGASAGESQVVSGSSNAGLGAAPGTPLCGDMLGTLTAGAAAGCWGSGLELLGGLNSDSMEGIGAGAG